MDNLVPIFGTIMVFGWLIVIAIMNSRKRREMYALYHQERMAAIEKGLELPPIPEDFFTEDDNGPFKEHSGSGKPRSPHRDLGWGLFWLLGGLAVLVALYFNFGGKVALFALIPIAIGLHHIIFYYAIGRKEAAAIEAERQAKAGQMDRDPVS